MRTLLQNRIRWHIWPTEAPVKHQTPTPTTGTWVLGYLGSSMSALRKCRPVGLHSLHAQGTLGVLN